MTWQNLSAPVILALTSIALAIIYEVKYSARFLVFLSCFLGLFVTQSFIYESFHPKQLVLYPLNFWAAYCLVNALHTRLLTHIEYLIKHLAGVSLAIWAIDLMSGGILRAKLSGVSIGEPYASIIDSYVIFQTFINEGVNSILPRNSGFAWEPGAFGVFCCLGLMLNLLRTKFSAKGNYGAGILTLGILSSLSTTGFSILAIFLVIMLRANLRGPLGTVLLPALSGLVIIAMLSLPFMQSKISDLWYQDIDFLADSASKSWNANQPIAAQRFLSLKMDIEDFLENPFTGYGGEEEQMYANRYGLNIVSISGIGKILGRFGILGICFFILCTIFSSIYIKKLEISNSNFILFFYIMMVSVSYSIIEHPLFIAIWGFRFLSVSHTSRRAGSQPVNMQ